MKNILLAGAALLAALPFTGRSEPRAIATQPERVEAAVEFDVNQFRSTQKLYSVPAGKRLVIENVLYQAVSWSRSPGDTLQLQVVEDGKRESHVVHLGDLDGRRQRVTRLAKRVEAREGADVSLMIRRGMFGPMSGKISLNGYLVDMN